MTRTIGALFGRVAAGLAAVSMVAAAGSASADPRWGYDYHRHGGGGKTEAAIVAGVVGLALGAAIANGSNDRSDRYERRRYVYAPPPPPPPPPRYSYYDDDDYAPPRYDRYRSECWVTRDYDRRSGTVYERTVCR